MVLYGGTKVYLSKPPKQEELERMTIDELIIVAKCIRSIKFPLKKYIMASILKIEIPNFKM